MSAGKSMEDVLRDIHLLISKCPKIKGDPDRVVINKQELFAELEKISQCMYDMLDEYSLSKQKKEEAQYQINKKYDETIAKATSTAEDVYSASVLYTDEAISRLVHILDQNKKDMDNLYHEINRQIENEKDKIRTLSSGMVAKMKIALTLARDAKVYMLDEPFNGIDLLARDEIRGAILEAAVPEKLLLLSSHLVEEMEAIADRAMFIRQGKLVEVRDLEEMRETDGVSMADRYREIFGHGEVQA